MKYGAPENLPRFDPSGSQTIFCQNVVIEMPKQGSDPKLTKKEDFNFERWAFFFTHRVKQTEYPIKKICIQPRIDQISINFILKKDWNRQDASKAASSP